MGKLLLRCGAVVVGVLVGLGATSVSAGAWTVTSPQEPVSGSVMKSDPRLAAPESAQVGVDSVLAPTEESDRGEAITLALDSEPMDDAYDPEEARHRDLEQLAQWWSPASVIAQAPNEGEELSEDDAAYRASLKEAGVAISELGWVHPLSQGRFASPTATADPFPDLPRLVCTTASTSPHRSAIPSVLPPRVK